MGAPTASPMQRNNSYIQSTGQSYSYIPPPSSPMVVSASQPCLSADAHYPNSIERIREAGLAVCPRLFASPAPRMLSFEQLPPPSILAAPAGPSPAPLSVRVPLELHAEAVPAGPTPAPLSVTRVPSCEGSFMALPLPLPERQRRISRDRYSVTAPSRMSFEAPADLPLVQRANSY